MWKHVKIVCVYKFEWHSYRQLKAATINRSSSSTYSRNSCEGKKINFNSSIINKRRTKEKNTFAEKLTDVFLYNRCTIQPKWRIVYELLHIFAVETIIFWRKFYHWRWNTWAIAALKKSLEILLFRPNNQMQKHLFNEQFRFARRRSPKLLLIFCHLPLNGICSLASDVCVSV